VFRASEIIQYQPGSGSSDHSAKRVMFFRLYEVTLIIFPLLYLSSFTLSDLNTALMIEINNLDNR